MPRIKTVQTPAAEPKPYAHQSGDRPVVIVPANDTPRAALTLTLNDYAIRDRGEMLSLTDMWKAASGSPSNRPVEWLRSKQATDFIGFLQETVGKSHLLEGGTGRNAQTFAHWQIALAYAKYLSPAFHAACNVVIRERMEGRPAPEAAFPADVLEYLRRTDGIARMLSHKVTEIERALPALRAEMLTALVEADPRAVATTYKPSLTVLEERGVPPKGRRGFSQRVSNRLRRFSVDRQFPMRSSHETGRWLFHVDAIAGWMTQEGDAMIRDHIDKITGQTRLHLVQAG